jgi:hypothetical protein
VIALILQLADAGTNSTAAGVLSLVVPLALLAVVLGLWWVALRHRQPTASERTVATPPRGDQR